MSISWVLVSFNNTILFLPRLYSSFGTQPSCRLFLHSSPFRSGNAYKLGSIQPANMFYTKTAINLSLAASALALPVPGDSPQQKRAGVLKATSYADLQVSDGVAGKALDEVKAKFPVSLRPVSSQHILYTRLCSDSSNRLTSMISPTSIPTTSPSSTPRGSPPRLPRWIREASTTPSPRPGRRRLPERRCRSERSRTRSSSSSSRSLFCRSSRSRAARTTRLRSPRRPQSSTTTSNSTRTLLARKARAATSREMTSREEGDSGWGKRVEEITCTASLAFNLLGSVMTLTKPEGVI